MSLWGLSHWANNTVHVSVSFSGLVDNSCLDVGVASGLSRNPTSVVWQVALGWATVNMSCATMLFGQAVFQENYSVLFVTLTTVRSWDKNDRLTISDKLVLEFRLLHISHSSGGSAGFWRAWIQHQPTSTDDHIGIVPLRVLDPEAQCIQDS